MSELLLQQIADKTLNKQALYQKVEKDFTLIPTLLEATSSPKATIRYSCAAVLMDLTAKYPEKLYPYMDKFLALLDSKHRILCWNAIYSVANLASVDTEGKFDAAFDRYFSFFQSGYMVTAANLAGASGKIATAKPYLASRIARELLKVEDLAVTPHLTEECKLVIAEHAIESLSLFFDKLDPETKRLVYEFANRQKNSSRQSLNKKANGFLAKWQL